MTGVACIYCISVSTSVNCEERFLNCWWPSSNSEMMRWNFENWLYTSTLSVAWRKETRSFLIASVIPFKSKRVRSILGRDRNGTPHSTSVREIQTCQTNSTTTPFLKSSVKLRFRWKQKMALERSPNFVNRNSIWSKKVFSNQTNIDESRFETDSLSFVQKSSH